MPVFAIVRGCYDRAVAVSQTLFEKIWNLHAVRQLPNGQTQLYVGLHLVHEVTSPQAFADLDAHGWRVRAPERTFATVDHIVPTRSQLRPFADEMAETMAARLEANCRRHGIPLFDLASGAQGIVHVIGPELGLTQPGTTITCGDSHTSTHGAFGALAFGIGTSQVRDVLASQCLAMSPLKVRKIEVRGALPSGVYAKDLILSIIERLGVNGGNGYAYEFAGDTVQSLSMDERMTICNMAIEGGARVGYVNPDETTFAYLRGRRFAPAGDAFERACAWWRTMASDSDATWHDVVHFDASAIAPTVTWGTNPGQSVPVDGHLPTPGPQTADRSGVADALEFMAFRAGQPIAGTKIDVAFIGSCTNARLSDLREAARIAAGRRVAPHVRALVVPGSQSVAAAAEREGLDALFRDAGFEWRGAGCSMCLAMNTDRLEGRQLCASSSNRNFKGRQGSPTGRTLLMSPAMVAAAAIAGEVVDVRRMGRHDEAGTARTSRASSPRERRGATGPHERACRGGRGGEAPRTKDEPGDGGGSGDRGRSGGRATNGADTVTRGRQIERITGRGVVIRGGDIDTDRIIPARFLRSITFDGLEQHVFADDRRHASTQGQTHPLDVTAHHGARVLIVNRNFGCGSSREHAPQALARWGIQAIVGESFGEIFAGNATAIGLACVAAADADVEQLMSIVERDPATAVDIDIRAGRAQAGDVAVDITLPRAAREALLSGAWNGTELLLANYDEVERVAAALPYRFS